MGIECLDQLGEVGERAGEPIDLIDDDHVGASGLHIGEEFPESPPFHRAAVLAAVELAREAGAPTKTHILNLLHRLVDGKPTNAAPVKPPNALTLTTEPQANVERHDALRKAREARHAHNPAAGAIIIMAHAASKCTAWLRRIGELTEQGSPAFEATLPILSQLLKAETDDREVRSTASQLRPLSELSRSCRLRLRLASEVDEALAPQLHRCSAALAEWRSRGIDRRSRDGGRAACRRASVTLTASKG